jgi:hypothetical protein
VTEMRLQYVTPERARLRRGGVTGSSGYEVASWRRAQGRVAVYFAFALSLAPE